MISDRSTVCPLTRPQRAGARAGDIRNGTFLATYRLVLLHVLYILPKQPTCTCSAPGVAWIVLGKQCARRVLR